MFCSELQLYFLRIIFILENAIGLVLKHDQKTVRILPFFGAGTRMRAQTYQNTSRILITFGELHRPLSQKSVYFLKIFVILENSTGLVLRNVNIS